MTDGDLSPRQKQVARLIRRGMTHEEVAAALRISVRTVEHHARRIREKRNAETTRAALRARPRGRAASPTGPRERNDP